MSSRSETVKAIVADFRREMRRIYGTAPTNYVTKRVEKAAAKVSASPAEPEPADLLKAAIAGDPAAQRAWRKAVMAGGEALQTEQATRTAHATATGRRAAVTKATAPVPLPSVFGPHPAPRADVAPATVAWAVEHLSNLSPNAVVPPEVAQRLRAAGIPLPTQRASDVMAWLAPKQRIDPVTNLPVDEHMRPITGGNTGEPTASV